jgi:hypothetical protein
MSAVIDRIDGPVVLVRHSYLRDELPAICLTRFHDG